MKFMNYIKVFCKKCYFYNIFFIYLNGDNMVLDVGDLVTRNSYKNDLVFEITDIVDDICYLMMIKMSMIL